MKTTSNSPNARHKIAVILASIIIYWAALPSEGISILSSGAGSGGDTVDRMLEATRTNLIATYSALSYDIGSSSLCDCSVDNTDIHCRHLLALTKEQRQYCRQFILFTASEVLRLNKAPYEVPFELVWQPLYVADPKGVMRPVRAVTQRGPGGEIKFHYDSVKMLWPANFLALLAHEFGHKVDFGGIYVDDNQVIGPFNQKGGGRALLDAVGSAIAVEALARNIVPHFLGSEDIYSCEITISSQSFSSFGRSPRLFRGPSLRSYETGIGNFPRDFSCRVDEITKRSYFTVRLLVHDDSDCAPLGPAETRYSELELWRVYLADAKGDILKPERVSSQLFRNQSPICDPTMNENMVIEYNKLGIPMRFSVRFSGQARLNQR